MKSLHYLAISASLLSPASATISGWQAAWMNEGPKVSLDQFDEVSFFAAVTTADGVKFDGDPKVVWAPQVEAAPDNFEPSLSVGGWGGSLFLSDLVLTDDSRNKFADQLTALVKDNSFIGIDFDWVFPNAHNDDPNVVNWRTSPTCAKTNKDDTANLLKFIKLLRKKLKAAALKHPKTGAAVDPVLTAAFPMDGLNDAEGKKLTDASAFVAKDALNYIAIMTYDVASNYRGATGINAPLSSKCAPEDQKMSIEDAVKYWHETAKVPKNKIQIGLPAYGKIFRLASDTTALADSNGSKAYTPKQMPLLDKSKFGKEEGNAPFGDKPAEDMCKVWRDYGATRTYKELVTSGLEEEGQAIVGSDEVTPAAGWEYYWDECTTSPFLFNSKERLFITYDNPRSMEAKSKWAKDQGLKGVKLFHLHGDDGSLIKAVNKGFKGE